MHHFQFKKPLTFIGFCLGLLISVISFAEDATPTAAKSAEETESAEKIDVEKLKQKYWAKGRKSELGVIQNRKFTKDGKFRLSAYGGFIDSDPFVTTYQAGGSLGYFFSEYVGLNLGYWYLNSTLTDAVKTLGRVNSKTGLSSFGLPANPQKGLGFAEVVFSPLYGKLSFLGSSIIYYDLFFSGGAGLMVTESGNYPAPVVGFQQQFYITNNIGVEFGFRFYLFKETFYEYDELGKIPGASGERLMWGRNTSLGVVFLLP